MPMITFPMILIAISSFYVLQLSNTYGILAAVVILLIGVACDIFLTMYFPPYLVVGGMVVAFMLFAIVVLIPWPFLFFAYRGQGSLIGGFKGVGSDAIKVIKAPVTLIKKTF